MEQEEEKKSTSIFKVIGIGCLTMFIIAGLGTWYVVKNIKKIGAEVVQKGAEMLVDETLLPEDEKKELKEVIKNQFKDKNNDKHIKNNLDYDNIIEWEE